MPQVKRSEDLFEDLYRAYWQPLSPRGHPIPDELQRGQLPPWFQTQADFLLATRVIQALGTAGQNALRLMLDRILEKWTARLNRSPIPGLPSAEKRVSVDRTCFSVCGALAESVLQPIFTEVWSAVKECVEGAGARFDQSTVRELEGFGLVAERCLCAWLSQCTFYALRAKLGTESTLRIRKVLSECMPGMAGRAMQAFNTSLQVVSLLARAGKRNGRLDQTFQNLSKVSSKIEIARAFGMSTKKLGEAAAAGNIRLKKLSRQRWQVCLDDVPVASRQKLRPT